MGYAQQAGFETILARGRRAAADLPGQIVYAGLSLGVMPAQMLAQTRPGAQGALLLHGCVPASEFGGWPDGVAVQVHVMEDDAWAEEDIPAARDLAAEVESAELFLYPGDAHLFTDASLPSYDEGAAALVKERVLSFLAGIG